MRRMVLSGVAAAQEFEASPGVGPAPPTRYQVGIPTLDAGLDQERAAERQRAGNLALAREMSETASASRDRSGAFPSLRGLSFSGTF